MSPLISLAVVAGISGGSASVVSRRMGVSRRWRRALTVTSVLVPPVGLLLLGGTVVIRSGMNRIRNRKSSAQKEKESREEMLRQMSPKERNAFLRREGMKELKANLERSEARVDAARLRSAARKDVLMGRSGWDETNLHGDRVYRFLLSRQARAETAFRADRRALQEYMLSTSVRETDPAQRLFSIRCNRLADGTLTFELPYDAGAEVLNEMRIALSRDWAVAVGDLSRARVTEHRSNDFQSISIGIPRTGMDKDIVDSTVFVYERDKGKVRPAGEQLTSETINKIYQAREEFQDMAREQAGKSHIIPDRDDMKAFITLHTLGLDTVALAFNGVAIAYATASPDGGIHMKGDDVPVGDKKALKMASAVQEKLSDCRNFGQWLDRAIEILHSPANVQDFAKSLERKATLDHSWKVMKELTERVSFSINRKL